MGICRLQGHSQTTVIYYKDHCRRRAVKGVENVEYLRSRAGAEAWTQYQEFKAREGGRAKCAAQAVKLRRNSGNDGRHEAVTVNSLTTCHHHHHLSPSSRPTPSPLADIQQVTKVQDLFKPTSTSCIIRLPQLTSTLQTSDSLKPSGPAEPGSHVINYSKQSESHDTRPRGVTFKTVTDDYCGLLSHHRLELKPSWACTAQVLRPSFSARVTHTATSINPHESCCVGEPWKPFSLPTAPHSFPSTMPAPVQRPSNGWLKKSGVHHESSTNRDAASKSSKSYSTASSAALSSNDDNGSASMEIVVDSQNALTGLPRSYWSRAATSEISAQNQLSSLNHGAQPEWMQEPQDQILRVKRSHKVDLSRYSYVHPNDKKKHLPTRQTLHATIDSRRRSKADVEAKKSQTASSSSISTREPILEPGEITREEFQKATVQDPVDWNGGVRVKRPERGVYQVPHVRKQATTTMTPGPGLAHASAKQVAGLDTPDEAEFAPPHLRNGMHASLASNSAANDDERVRSSASPSGNEKIQTPFKDKCSAQSAQKNQLLTFLKGLGLQNETAALRSISDIIANHQSSAADPTPKMMQAPKHVRGVLSLDSAAILERSYQARNSDGDWSLPTLSEKTMTPSPTSQKGRKADRDPLNEQIDGKARSVDRIETGSYLANESANGHTGEYSDSHIDGKTSKAKVAVLSKERKSEHSSQAKSKGKARASSKVAGNDGMKIGDRTQDELEDWHERAPYWDPAERKAVASAFAEEQANIEPDEIVDVTTRDFQAGLDVLVDGQEDIRAEKERDKQEPRRADSLGQMILAPSQKTSNDHAGAHMQLKDHPHAHLIFDIGKEFRKMSKAERREISAHFKTGPNPHAPKADIYLRPAETGDANQINDIWNYHIQNSIDVGYEEPWSPAAWPDQIRQDTGIRLPFLVAVLKHGKKDKRAKNEHIVGFGRAIACGDDSNAWRFSVELEIYVRNHSFRMGIGKTLFDRLMAAVAGPPYFTKNCAPLLGVAERGLYDDGMFRRCHTILVSIFHNGPKDASLKWKEAFLKANDFVKSGCIPEHGWKFGKFYDMTQYYFHTIMEPRS